MPDLVSLPRGTLVFVDTNILDLHFKGRSVSCSTFISRIAQREVTAYVNTLVLSDLMHKMMLAEAYTKNLIPRPTASVLKAHLWRNRTDAALLVDYQTQFNNTLAIGLKVLSVTKDTLTRTFPTRSLHALLTTDSLHLGCMARHRVQLTNIVTYDGDFSHIPGITVWSPSDVVP